LLAEYKSPKLKPSPPAVLNMVKTARNRPVLASVS
jgi:hypothetical protein